LDDENIIKLNISLEVKKWMMKKLMMIEEVHQLGGEKWMMLS